MKQLQVWFEEKEYKEMTGIKEKHGGNWHDFILDIIRSYNDKGGKR